MACLEMYNPDHKGAPPPPLPPASPRISFSNEFAESSSYHHHHHLHHHHHHQTHPPISSTDFEFSVTSNNSLQLTAADELFFKGRILPSRPPQTPPPPPTVTTLREELLAGDDDDEDDDGVLSLKPPQSHKGRWKGFLGLRKSHIGSRKPDPSPLRASFHEPNNFFSFPLQDHPRSPHQGVLREDEEGTGGGADTEMKL